MWYIIGGLALTLFITPVVAACIAIKVFGDAILADGDPRSELYQALDRLERQSQ